MKTPRIYIEALCPYCGKKMTAWMENRETETVTEYKCDCGYSRIDTLKRTVKAS